MAGLVLNGGRVDISRPDDPKATLDTSRGDVRRAEGRRIACSRRESEACRLMCSNSTEGDRLYFGNFSELVYSIFKLLVSVAL